MSSSAAAGSGNMPIEIREDVLEIIWGGSEDLEATLERFRNLAPNNSTERQRSATATTFTVHPHLRAEDPDAYDPKVVSVGPYHSSKVDDFHDFQKTHVLKVQYLDEFLDGEQIGKYSKAMEKMEVSARSCYPKDDILSSINEDALARMLLLDGCFVLRRFGVCRFGEAATTFRHLERDLLLLENQIPFSVPKKLHELKSMAGAAQTSNADASPLIEVVIREFCNSSFITEVRAAGSVATGTEAVANTGSVGETAIPVAADTEAVTSTGFLNEWSKSFPAETERESYNILDIFHYCIRPRLENEAAGPHVPDERATSIPTARELHDKGINFKNSKEKSLDLRFKKGVLEMPLLKVNEDTIVLLRNLIALEECRPGMAKHVSNYVRFMSFLVKSHDDVSLLRQKRVLVNELGRDEEVAASFVKLSKNVSFDFKRSHVKELMIDMNNQYRGRVARWIAELTKNHFASPWKIISFVLAVILIVITIAQLVFTILKYKKRG